MQTNIKTTNIEMTDSISKEVDKQMRHIEKILHERDSDSAMMSIEIGKETNHHKQGDIFFTKLNLDRDGDHFTAASEREDLFQSIDEAIIELRRQVKHNQKKRTNLGRERGKKFKDFLTGFKRKS